jgi:hypothetical protein
MNAVAKEEEDPMLKLLSMCAVLALDPATLPSLDSIQAKTDVSAFLQPCVPRDVQLAALHRAWSADPAIRDFRGLAESDWDFTAPDSMFGFGDLEPDLGRRMVAQVFGDGPHSDQPVTLRAPAKRASILARIAEIVLPQTSTFK